MSDGKTILDADAIQRGLTRIAHEIAERNTDIDRVGLIGIQRGGDLGLRVPRDFTWSAARDTATAVRMDL